MSLTPLARRLLGALEPVATLPWFSVELFEEMGKAGFPGWTAYFCSRAAPLGPITPELAIALFYNWKPEMVRRELRWDNGTPADARAAFLEAARRAFERVVAPAIPLHTPEIVRIAALLKIAAQGCELQGRPIFAAFSAEPWPQEPAIAMWHGATLLREYRGDVHNAVLVSHGLGPIDALLLNGNWITANVEKYIGSREWTMQDAAPAIKRLQERSFVDENGAITEGGLKYREMVELDTDRRALAPIEALGPTQAEELLSLLAPICKTILEARAVPSLVGRVARGI